MRGRTKSSSSVEASVGKVGLMMEAVDEAGSTEAMLERIEGIDTRDSVLNGHRGGDSGGMGRVKSRLGRGVGSSSGAGVVTGLDSGDFFRSDPLRSLPFPSTVFLSDPFLFLFCTSAIAPRGFSFSAPSLLSWSPFVRRMLSFDRRLPEIDRLWPGVLSARFFVFTSFSCGSSSIAGKGVCFSGDSEAPFIAKA